MRQSKGFEMRRIGIAVACILLLTVGINHYAEGATHTEDLETKIKERADEISRLEKEIREYEGKIGETQKEASSLTKTIQSLETTEKKLSKDIQLTTTKIDASSLAIERLELTVESLETKIATNKDGLEEAIRRLKEAEDRTLMEAFLRRESLSEFWQAVDDLETVEKHISVNLKDLRETRAELVAAQAEEKRERETLVGLKERLSDQKAVTQITKSTKNKILSETKNRQSNYEKLLADRLEKKRIFEEELASFEAELRERTDRSLLPTPRGGVLAFPLKKFTVTQNFGYTDFAQKNPGIYRGGGHNGVDFGAPIGQAVYAARAGTVVATGDTDTACPNASYGKWVLVAHDNGLHTLYAHLSLIKASSGENVSQESVIGYVGSTGYATGPHLHFTVFASDSVQIGTLPSRVCGGRSYTIPLLSKNGGYLNPLSYLPAL